MVSPLLLFSTLISLHPICQGKEIDSTKIAGPKYAIIKGDFLISVFEKKRGPLYRGTSPWGYQSLMEDDKDENGYCGYCKNEQYKGALFCEEDIECKHPDFGSFGKSFFLRYSEMHNGEPLYESVSTSRWGSGSSCCDTIDMTPVPGAVKLMTSTPLPVNWSGTYNITRQLYNGFQQYERDGGARIYVNIYNQWVIGTRDHREEIIMSQMEATPSFESVQSDWSMSVEHVDEDDTIITLSTEMDLPKSSGQPPECIIEGNRNRYYIYKDNLFKLTPDGTYVVQVSENYTDDYRRDDTIRDEMIRDDNQRYYNRSSYGWWALYDNTKWIKEEKEGNLYWNPEHFRTSESSEVIPGLGWGVRVYGPQNDYAPDYDIQIIGSPCSITLTPDSIEGTRNSATGGTYNIEEELVNEHPAYTRQTQNDKFSLYVNPSKKWVFGQIKKNPSTQEMEREEILILSQDLTKTPLTWPEPWTNQGTQKNPILMYNAEYSDDYYYY